jgi:MSHA biogenesis protein MshI
MSLITTLSQFFSKAESKHKLGITLTQKLLSYCYFSEHDAVRFNALPLSSVSEIILLKSLSDDADLHGQGHLILSSSHYQIVQVDKPKVPDNEIRAALKWQIKDLVTFSPEDMIVDYFDGPTLSGGVEKINVVCASKKLLSSFVGSLSNGTVKLASITTEEFAFANLLPKSDNANLLVCQQPNEEIVLLIIKQGKLYFHRRLRGFANIANESEQELSMGSIDRLSLEIQRSTDYFERQLKQPPIKSIKLLLPVPKETYFRDKLAENTHIAVTLLALPAKCQDQRGYAASIGATLLDGATKDDFEQESNTVDVEKKQSIGEKPEAVDE